MGHAPDAADRPGSAVVRRQLHEDRVAVELEIRPHLLFGVLAHQIVTQGVAVGIGLVGHSQAQ